MRVLVTGCSSGIGHALVPELIGRGHEVIATARDPSALRDLPDGTVSLALDVTDPDSVQSAVARAGPIDALVNNAAWSVVGPVEGIPIEAARRVFEVNFFGAARMIQAVVPGMRARGSGVIVNVSSLAGRVVPPLGGFYAASKFALEALSEALHLELSHFGVRVAIVEPGYVATSFRAKAGHFGIDGPPYDELERQWSGSDEKLVGGTRPGPAPVALAIADAMEGREDKLRWVVGKGRGARDRRPERHGRIASLRTPCARCSNSIGETLTTAREAHFRPFLRLLIALVALTVTAPLTQFGQRAGLLFDLAFSIVLLFSLVAVGPGRYVRIGASATAALAIVLRWWAFAAGDSTILLASALVAASLLAFVVYSLLRFLFVTRDVSLDTIYGGVAVYAILGILWGMLYVAIELAAPGSFLQSGRPVRLVDSSSGLVSLLYYSFVTLTTLGYGDVVPMTASARILSAAEAVSGQLYLAVLVARLVGLHISAARSP